MAAAIRSTAREGVDLILDPQGTAMLDLDLEVAAPGARIILFGNASGAPLAPLPPLGQLMGANISIRGFSLAALAAKAPTRLAAALTRVLNALADSTLTVDVTVLEGLDATADAQQALADGRGDTKYAIHIGA